MSLVDWGILDVGTYVATRFGGVDDVRDQYHLTLNAAPGAGYENDDLFYVKGPDGSELQRVLDFHSNVDSRWSTDRLGNFVLPLGAAGSIPNQIIYVGTFVIRLPTRSVVTVGEVGYGARIFGDDVDPGDSAIKRRLQAMVDGYGDAVDKVAYGAPRSIRVEALMRAVSWGFDNDPASGAAGENGLERSGALALVSPWQGPGAGLIG